MDKTKLKIGYRIEGDDGKRYLRIEEAWTGDVWDEPIADYEEVIDLIRNETYYRHKRTGERVWQE